MLYVAGADLKNIGSGVEKKIISQIEVFSLNLESCRFYCMPYVNENNTVNKILRRIPLINTHKKWQFNDFINEKYIYIRNLGPWDHYAVTFFSKLKEVNPNLLIVYELPTYPYDGELAKSWEGWPLLLKDKWNRHHLHKFIDRIATLTDDKEIFGVPTLKIGNGVDVDKIRPRQVQDTDVVHAIAVANFEWWHGYDRFLDGLKSYYADNPLRKVIFHLVGHGSEFGRYQKLVNEYGLGDYVILHDQQTDEALDAIYDQCNLGIASLGFHRTGLTEGAPLKTREYLAKGLPFILGAKVSDISDADKDNIYLQVPNDDSTIDIGAVLNFYDRIYSEGAEQVNIRLRQFAKEHFSMEVAMKEVIDFFKND